MAENSDNPHVEEKLEFEENPYNPEKKKPEDIVRLFYVSNVPIIPVVSKTGMLIGILRKEDVISELSDIERAEKLNIDKFINKLAIKISLDDLLSYGKIKEFVVINIFGEVQGKWPRLRLFTAAESFDKNNNSDYEVQKQKEEQILEWMIYLILEHIPRALYAINDKGKTIFYNNYFELLYKEALDSDVDTAFFEESINNADRNELISRKHDGDLYFYNNDIGIYYEKIPLISKKQRVGFLIYCCNNLEESTGVNMHGIDVRDMSLADIVKAVERQVIVDALNNKGDLKTVAELLKISRKALNDKIEKYAIEIKKLT